MLAVALVGALVAAVGVSQAAPAGTGKRPKSE